MESGRAASTRGVVALAQISGVISCMVEIRPKALVCLGVAVIATTILSLYSPAGKLPSTAVAKPRVRTLAMVPFSAVIFSLGTMLASGSLMLGTLR